MALLNSHKLTLYKRTNRNNAFLKCRRKLISKIDEQILLTTDCFPSAESGANGIKS